MPNTLPSQCFLADLTIAVPRAMRVRLTEKLSEEAIGNHLWGIEWSRDW